MYRTVLVMSAIVSLLFSVACVYLATRTEVRGLIAASPVVDFGKVPQQTTLDARFELVNRFDFPITIAEIVRNCDCLETSCSQHVLAPGERTVVETTWDTGARHGPSSTRLLVTYFRDPLGPHSFRELRLVADVVPDFDCRPASLTFDPSEPAEEVAVFSPGRKADFHLSKAYCTHSAFEARLLGDGLRVIVSFDPGEWRDGTIVPQLIVETNSAVEPTYRVPLRVTERESATRLASGSFPSP